MSILACNLPGYTGGPQNYHQDPVEPIQPVQDPIDPAMVTSDDLQTTSLPTITPSPLPTNTPTVTPTNTSTNTPTNTPTNIPTHTPTFTPTIPPTPTPTATNEIVFVNIQGSVWWDKNRNGVRDSSQGEIGLYDQNISLWFYNCTQRSESAKAYSTKTQQWTGVYKIDQIFVSTGTYCLVIEAEIGCDGKTYTDIFETNLMLNMIGETKTVDFGAKCPLVLQP